MAKIAFLLPNLGGGGAERVAVTLTEALVGRGHEVELVVMEKAGELLTAVHPDVRLVDLKAPRTRNAVWPLVGYLRRSRPDVLQASMWPLTIAAIIACRLSGNRVRCVVSDHSVLSAHYPLSKHRAIGASVRLLYPLASARVCVSAGAADDLSKLSGLDRNSISVIPNPVAFPSELRRSSEVEARWGSARKRILTVGQLKPEKSHALLIRAIAKLPPEIGARLMIAGDGALRFDLERVADAEGVRDRVLFIGFVPDPWPFYASADLFALGSIEESFGNVLVEALYAGLPIVSTSSVGARAVLEDGRWGRIIATRDPHDIAVAIVEALQEKPDRQALRRRAVALSGTSSIDAYEAILVPR